MESKTIESFFVQQYEELKAENESLRKSLTSMKPAVSPERKERWGCEIEEGGSWVRFEVASKYSMNKGSFEGKTSQEVEELAKDMDKAVKLRADYRDALEIHSAAFINLLRVELPGKSRLYGIGSQGEVTEICDQGTLAALNEWIHDTEENRERLMALAKDKLRENIKARAAELRKKEQAEAEGSTDA